MVNIFFGVLNLSITASYLIIAILLARLFLKKSPRRITFALWGLVGIRLVLPFSFESVLSLIPSTEAVDISSGSPVINSGMDIIDSVVNPIISDNIPQKSTVVTTPSVSVNEIISILWVSGVFLILLYGIISYIIIRRRVIGAVLLADNIWQSEGAPTPFILGIFKPKIYIPFNLDGDSRQYVIAHEKAHLKRFDHLIKPLGFVLLAVYWFNPLVWIEYILLCRDIELACDEKVIREMDEKERKAYAYALLSCSSRKSHIAVCPLAFGEVGVKERVKGIMNYKKPAFWIVAMALLLSIALAVCFLTSPGIPLTALNEDAVNFSGMFDNVELMELITANSYRAVTEQDILNDIISDLRKVRIDSDRIFKSRAEDRDQTYRISIDNNGYLNFSKDFTEYWVDTGLKPTFSYRVINPSAVQSVFDKYITVTADTEREIHTPGGLVQVNSSFCATVIEIAEQSILVTPFSDLDELRSADKIWVSVPQSQAFSVGDEVEIFYDGQIAETYPAVIDSVYSVTLLDQFGTADGNISPVEAFVVSQSHVSASNYDRIYMWALNSNKMTINSMQHLPIYKFSSADELNGFKETLKDSIIMDESYGDIPSFDEVSVKYDETFFENNALLLVFVSAPSGSYRYGVDSVYNDGKYLTVHVIQTNDPKDATDDEQGWFITLSINKEAIENCVEFDADFDNIES